MSELTILEEFSVQILDLQEQVLSLPKSPKRDIHKRTLLESCTHNWDAVQNTEQVANKIVQLVHQILDLYSHLPEPLSNKKHTLQILFWNRPRLLLRSKNYYYETMTFLKIYLELNTTENRKAWNDSISRQFFAHQHLQNQINNEIQRWKQRES